MNVRDYDFSLALFFCFAIFALLDLEYHIDPKQGLHWTTPTHLLKPEPNMDTFHWDCEDLLSEQLPLLYMARFV